MIDPTALDEDKPADSKEFAGATLQINDIIIDENKNDENENAGISGAEERGNGVVSTTAPATSFSRNTPGRSSIMSRTSRASRISLKPGCIHSDKATGLFYSYKVNIIME